MSLSIEEAYEEMQKRGWGFQRNYNSGIIFVGPYDGLWVKALAFDTDPAKAVEKAIAAIEVKGEPKP